MVLPFIWRLGSQIIICQSQKHFFHNCLNIKNKSKIGSRPLFNQLLQCLALQIQGRSDCIVVVHVEHFLLSEFSGAILWKCFLNCNFSETRLSLCSSFGLFRFPLSSPPPLMLASSLFPYQSVWKVKVVYVLFLPLALHVSSNPMIYCSSSIMSCIFLVCRTHRFS